MMTEAEAKAIADSIPGITPAGSLLVRAIGRLESSYGSGWSGAGVGSHNWGAITGTFQGQYFEYGDSRYDPESGEIVKYTTRFAKYPSDFEGAKAIWDWCESHDPEIARSAEKRDWLDVSTRLRDAKYYLGTKPRDEAIQDHVAAMRKNLVAISQATGEVIDPVGTGPGPEPLPAPSVGRGVGMTAGVLIMLTVGLIFWGTVRMRP